MEPHPLLCACGRQHAHRCARTRRPEALTEVCGGQRRAFTPQPCTQLHRKSTTRFQSLVPPNTHTHTCPSRHFHCYFSPTSFQPPVSSLVSVSSSSFSLSACSTLSFFPQLRQYLPLYTLFYSAISPPSQRRTGSPPPDSGQSPNCVPQRETRE